MNTNEREALTYKLFAMADDELLLGHRDSEWTGHAPILEEDIAFANIALDEIGHANLWYQLIADLKNENRDTYPDQLVFQRDLPDWRNAQIAALPKGDWAFTIVRQYLFDAAELARLEGLTKSTNRPVAEVAGKILAEERYHHRHTSAWVRRLGLGTEESHDRTQRALTTLWPFAGQLMASLPGEEHLVAAGMVPSPDAVLEAWHAGVLTWLQESDLQPPDGIPPVTVERGIHTEHLVTLLGEMQSVARLEPTASW